MESRSESWAELSRASHAAAAVLLAAGFYRSSVSRAYYSLYAGLVSALERVAPGPYRWGWNNPPHSQLEDLCRSRLGASGHDIADSLAIMRRYREDADYRPTAVSGPTEAATCVRESADLLRQLRIL